MNARTVCAAGVVMMALALGSEAQAQNAGQIKLEGEIHDFTGPMTPADPAGPWQIDGNWTLTFNPASGKVEIAAALNMIRSDNATRQGHTHHVRVADGQIAPIAGGYRITGTGAVTSNGALAPFSGSPVTVDITGGNALAFATVKMTFGGAAAGHFGGAALNGVVSMGK
jgi:hypothetical protein